MKPTFRIGKHVIMLKNSLNWFLGLFEGDILSGNSKISKFSSEDFYLKGNIDEIIHI